MKKPKITEFMTPEKQKKKIKKTIMTMLTMILLMTIALVNPVFAADSTITDIVTNMIQIIELVFQVVGVILSAYSAGQLVLAIKNEDADSKARASTQLVVGVILIGLPTIINNLNLVNKITVSVGTTPTPNP